MAKTFLHSGRLGDVIYSLPTIQALGGGHLYLRPEPRLAFSHAAASSAISLLRSQPAITGASLWCGQRPDFLLDQFRNKRHDGLNLVDAHLKAFDAERIPSEEGWLTVDGPQEHGHDVIFARSLERPGLPRFWLDLYELLGRDAAFVGTRAEHRAFCRQYGTIRFLERANLLELARVIAGAKLFVGNQSCPYAIAEGLGVPAILQVDPESVNCVFGREDVLAVSTLEQLDMVTSHSERFLDLKVPRSRATRLLGSPRIVDHGTAGQLGPAIKRGTSVVIVTFNSRATIEACLSSVLPQLGDEDDLIVIDNASQDRTASYLGARLSEWPRCTVVLNSENRGFSAACNQGMRLSRGRQILLLNPDTTFMGESLGSMVAHLRDPQIAAVGPLSNAVAGLQRLGYSGGKSRLALESKLLIGFCLMLRRSALDKVGLLSEELFLGSDDLEMSWRLRSAGYKMVVATDVIVRHLGGVSFASLPAASKERFVAESTDALIQRVRRANGFFPSA